MMAKFANENPNPDCVRELESEILSVSKTLPPPLPQFNAKPDMVEETSRVGEQIAHIQWPEKMDAVAFEDFEYWIQGVLRKAAREAGIEDYGKSPK